MDKKKIALLSWTQWANFGTQLQAYALAFKIKQLGYDCEYLDIKYEKVNVDISKKSLFFRKLKHVFDYSLREIFYALIFMKRGNVAKMRFKNFRSNNIPISEDKYYSYEQLEHIDQKYSKFIVGSDQTWSPNIDDDMRHFFLSFTDSPHKYSYASSFGTNNISKEYLEKVCENINKFKCISCREDSGCVILRKELKRDISKVEDPTLLLTVEEWMSLIDKSEKKKVSEKYIVTYFLKDNSKHYRIAKQIAQKNNFKLYNIVTVGNYTQLHNGSIIYDLGPIEFLYLLQNSKFICTDSFHATLFAMLFNKQFISFLKRKGSIKTGDNVRIYDFLKRYNLEHRLMTKEKIEDIFKFSEIDYSKINILIDNERSKSLEFLKKICDD